MKKILFLLFATYGLWIATFSQNIGIGTNAPVALLQVVDSNVVFSATGDIPMSAGGTSVSGAGRRMLWYPGKAAFRVGYVTNINWDQGFIGNYSFAAGYDTRASGFASVAMGVATASGEYSIALGHAPLASGNYSTAIGYDVVASGINSVALGNSTTAKYNGTAMGYLTEANGDFSTAMGHGSVADGDYSTAMGIGTKASGNTAIAMGREAIASGDYSIAIGSLVSTNGHDGALVIGDASSLTFMNAASNNSFRARFSNGYRFYTSSDLSTNAYLAAGDNAWSTTSDIRKKENFEEVNGEDALKKISAFHLGSWNYKSQDAKIFRHYGPMAQDFYAAFGKDDYGTIGNDTTINQADFNGVNFIAIEALEKRTEKIEQLEIKDRELETRNEQLEQELAMLKRKLDEHDKALSGQLQELKQQLLGNTMQMQSSIAKVKL
jgi:Head domain of trimeric autotransporter adhesin/Chaperone of endosialidase